MTNPFKVEVFIKECCLAPDDGTFKDASQVEYLVAHIQELHSTLTSPSHDSREGTMSILRTVQLVSGSLSVLLCAIAKTNPRLAYTLTEEITEQLLSRVADLPEAAPNSPECEVLPEEFLDASPCEPPDELFEDLDEEQRAMVRLLALNPALRWRH